MKIIEINGQECYDCGRGIFIKKETKCYTTKEFLKFFTIEEQTAIMSNEAIDPNVKLLLFKLNCNHLIYMNSENVINGINYLVSQNLLTQERADYILSL